MKTDLSCYSANITTAPPTLSGLLKGLRHVLAAGADDSMRETNRNQDNIVRDWRAALDPAVEALALHFAARS